MSEQIIYYLEVQPTNFVALGLKNPPSLPLLRYRCCGPIFTDVLCSLGLKYQQLPTKQPSCLCRVMFLLLLGIIDQTTLAVPPCIELNAWRLLPQHCLDIIYM